MSSVAPAKVLITGGKPGGGIASFAEALRLGFVEAGIPAEIASPNSVVRRVRELRDPSILKILSLSALFAAPLARRALCISHGIPCVAHQGVATTLAVLASFRTASVGRGVQMVAVSDYTAVHLRNIFGLRIDAVIRNPVQPLFLQKDETKPHREAITYAGRLHRSKNIDRLLPAMIEVLDENPGLHAWVVGDGPMRMELERMVRRDERVEFLGPLQPKQVRERLRRSRAFISGNPTEPFGIVYLEALSQGCAVAMPASGGGLEIAPDMIGKRIFVFSPTMRRESIAAALRAGLAASHAEVELGAYAARSVAESYRALDARFDRRGIFHTEHVQ